VVLTSAAGVHAEAIAQQVVGYLLAFERGLHRAWRQQSRGVWENFRPGELGGATLGVVGLGSIGGRTAELVSAFDVTVVGTKRDPSTAPAAADAVYSPDGLYEVLPESDYLLISCPLTDETRGLIGADALDALSDDAVLVNVARGAIVDQDALTRALQGGSLGGAALDVFEEEPLPAESPLWELSNVVVTPHNAGWGSHTLERAADLFAENYRRFADGEYAAMENRVV
jgi:phosphoglycerate dehydrogenase-like enzyme